MEFTASYNTGGFSAYANIANSVAKGETWSSAQFLFAPADLAYVKNHWIYLDHDQDISASFGASYLFKEAREASTRAYVDALYGTGLRTDATAPDGLQHSQRRDCAVLLLGQHGSGTEFQDGPQTGIESPP